MQLSFSKYHGTGNDFIIIDNRLLQLELEEKEIMRLCHRRFGIGADGLMLLNGSDYYPFEMRYYNSDGKLGSMCGNGGRCIVAFARKLQLFGDKVDFMAFDGIHTAEVLELFANQTMVKLAMQDVKEKNIENLGDAFLLDTGSPHYVAFVDKVDDIDVYTKGKEIRNNSRFLEHGGVNVNFVEIQDNYIFVRTYERGVENETYSCGTGVVASALIFAKRNGKEDILVKTKGGELRVFLKHTLEVYKNIFLQGYAVHSYDGIFEINTLTI